MVWYGILRYGMVWYGIVYGIVWYGMEWYHMMIWQDYSLPFVRKMTTPLLCFPTPLFDRNHLLRTIIYNVDKNYSEDMSVEV